MRYLKLIVVLLIAVIVYSCGTQLQQLQTQTKPQLESKNYKGALTTYQEFIQKSETSNTIVEPQVYFQAAKVAYLAKEFETAKIFFEKIRYSKIETIEYYKYAAKTYKAIDNLSRELDFLESYTSNFPVQVQEQELINRMFLVYVESENFDKAFDYWEKLNPSKNKNEALLIGYLTVCTELQKGDPDHIANSILFVNNKSVTALKYWGIKYYKKAESIYKPALDAYNKKRTNKRYKKLLKAIEDSTSSYQAAKKKLLEAYNLSEDKEAAKYLANVYARFNDKRNHNYYKSRSK